MTDLTLKHRFTDRGGNEVYDVFMIGSGGPEPVGQIRIPPDPRIKELERTSQYWKDEHLAGNKHIKELEAQIDAIPHDSMCTTIIGDKCDCWRSALEVSGDEDT